MVENLRYSRIQVVYVNRRYLTGGLCNLKRYQIGHEKLIKYYNIKMVQEYNKKLSGAAARTGEVSKKRK